MDEIIISDPNPVNVQALMDSIVGIDQALTQENNTLRDEFLKSNIDFINQQLIKPEYQEALTQEQKDALEAAMNRARMVIL